MCSRSSIAGSTTLTAADENAAIVQRIFDAFARKEGFALRGLFAEDAVWTVPGGGTMAGTFHGRDEIFRFLGRLPKETDGTYRSELIDVLASERRAAALYRARGERQGRRLELDQLLLFTIEGGVVREVLALPSDPAAFDAFWAPTIPDPRPVSHTTSQREVDDE
jgi:ketosteroid isomerase-like protein